MADHPPAHPTPWLRAAIIGCWLVIAGLVVRIGSGGGTLTGVGYVLRTEPLAVVLIGAGLLAVAVALVAALARRHVRAWRASTIAAALVLPGWLLLFSDGHDSALLGVVAAILALWLGRAAWAPGPDLR
ncbi:MAG: hypothetical protein ACLGIJ_01835 [Candidatus Limnocylindria bacterium]